MRLNLLLQRLLWMPVAVLLVSLVTLTGYVALWLSDDAPPFVNGSYTATPAKAGRGMIISRELHRDVKRRCSIIYSRVLFDGAARMHDIVSGQRVSPQMRDLFERKTPGRQDEVVQIPEDAAPGDGWLITDMEYRCNPLQAIRPISVRLELPIRILQP